MQLSRHIRTVSSWTAALLTFALVTPFCLSSANAGEDKPNFVFILSEDNSKHYLELYGSEYGKTPAIEALAKEGLLFKHAFSNAPVCSVARTTLMTGILAPKAGFQYHRKNTLAHLPDGVKMWPAYLRQAGYYTSNNSKKDYNVVEGDGVWDESSRNASWRKRPSQETPFFHMQTFTTTHESSLHFPKEAFTNDIPKTPANDVYVAPYHPDTPTFRFTQARYFDRIEQVDRQIGNLIDQLEADGLMDNTFIFYFGDHGGVLPRGKGYLYESGLHVPLVIRIPEKWRSEIPLEIGSKLDAFVSFIDFGPTLLHLAGLRVPGALDGSPFLGPDITPAALEHRDETFGYADRMDEKYDLCRSIRKGHFKYIRNFQAFYPDGLQNNYRYRMLAYAEWRKLFLKGELNETQSAFFKSKPAEMLFDLRQDPYETHNLANDPAHKAVLEMMRERLFEKMDSIHDLSMYPESYMAQNALNDGIAYGKAHAREIKQLLKINLLATQSFEQAKPTLIRALRTRSPLTRYWALTVCSVFGKAAEEMKSHAVDRLNDDDPLVNVRAAEFLGILGEQDPRPTFYKVLNEDHGELVALITLNAAAFFHDNPNGYPFDVKALNDPEGKAEVKRRLDYFANRL